ncbi:MAG: ComF family protein [Anaerolineales bacterium]
MSLKHRRNQELGQALANYLLQAFRQQDWDIDFVIPIPLGTKRKKERGYNQVDLLAAPFAMAAGIRAAENVLVRKHDTLPQFELNAAERWKNLHGSFVADPTPLRGRDVLLLDDIMTTGATLDSAAQALMDAGAGRIYGLTLARALFEDEGEFGKIGYT